MSTKLPEHLHAAFDWIDIAGEWAEALTDADYAREAFANAQQHGEADVTLGGLREVIEWKAGSVTWHTPPMNQGQIVEVSYGQDDEGECWERTRDHASGLSRYRYLGHATDSRNTRWDPWNSVPAIAEDEEDETE